MKSPATVIVFVLKFFGSYFLLLIGYDIFLKITQQHNTLFLCDPLTETVATHTVGLLNFFGFHAAAIQHQAEFSIKIILEDVFIARVIEGCNSMSLIILFLAFIIAFRGKLLSTILFGFSGAVLIYLVNIFRIALLSVGLLYAKEYSDVLHGLFFPAIIYGTVFLLWMVWVNYFSNIKN